MDLPHSLMVWAVIMGLVYAHVFNWKFIPEISCFKAVELLAGLRLASGFNTVQ